MSNNIFIIYSQLNAPVVAFRGTQPYTLINDVEDATFAPLTPYPGSNARVHVGFYASYQSVRRQIEGILLGIMDKVNASGEIYITGHSLGGALATMCAAELYRPGMHITLGICCIV